MKNMLTLFGLLTQLLFKFITLFHDNHICELHIAELSEKHKNHQSKPKHSKYKVQM
jgi:hypothetical protein